MKLSKSSSYVLIALLRGYTTSAMIANFLQGMDIRTIQRALARLLELSLITGSGPSNDPTYAVSYPHVLALKLDEKILIDEQRPESIFNYDLVDWLAKLTPADTEQYIGSHTFQASEPMSARELEHLTIELSWKSSALEGNTYSLLDAQLLLTEGIRAKNRTEFETQMILNHKNAIQFIAENRDVFSSTIAFAAVEELHKIIAHNLGIDTGVRKRIVKISASNYTPPETPHKIREAADAILRVINAQQSPFTKSLLALSLMPYLQTFEDGNKRTGRMLANAILISTVNRGFSLRTVEARDLALAYLAFYEFNSLYGLRKVLQEQLSQ